MKKINYAYLTKPVEVYERENGHTVVLAHKDGELVKRKSRYGTFSSKSS